jgi:integrase
MPTQSKLSAAKVKTAGPGKYEDGAGLRLIKRSTDVGTWVLRVTTQGRRREMGLGGWPAVSLAEARDVAVKWRTVVRQGDDPVKVRAKEKREAAAARNLLRDVAADAFDARKAELKGDGEAGRWMSPLELHVLPKLGAVPVGDLDQRDVRDALAPLWHTKSATAEKALNRLGIVMRHAAALGLEVDLQVTAKARALLGRQRHKVENIPAVPWIEVPAFYISLRDDSPTDLALRLLILTAVRSTPVRNIDMDQINGDVWTVPAELVKGRRDKTEAFRVPLSSEAQKVIRAAQPFARDGILFPGAKRGTVISDMTLSMYMRRRDMEARPHGFRSSFRTWCAEAATDTPHDVAEWALGHTVGGKVERAYQRSDHLDARRALMCRWADFVTGGTGAVVQITARAAG